CTSSLTAFAAGHAAPPAAPTRRSPDLGVEPAGDFTATVDWGIAGHHADATTITQPGGAGTSYTVTATRPVFSEEGSYTVTVSISVDSTSTTARDTQTVSEPAIPRSSAT